jgi:hypothetical protein
MATLLSVLAGLAGARGAVLIDVGGKTPFPKGCGVPGVQSKNTEAEPSIAVNPRNARNIVIAYQQDRFAIDGGALSNVVAVTKDGGTTWKRVLVKGLSRCTGGKDERSSDAWLSFAGDGTLYLASLTFSETPTNSLVAGPTKLVSQVSHDGGYTWGPAVDVQPTDRIYNDREAITADPKRKGFAYYAFVKRLGVFGESGPEMFSRTTDGGKTWSTPVPIFVPPPLTLTDPTLIKVLPDGTLLNLVLVANLSPFLPDQVPRVPWLIIASRSTDEGATWSVPVVIARMKPSAPTKPDGGNVVRSYNVISFDVARDGTAYVAWNEIVSATDSTIFVARSTDDGQSWSGPVVVKHVATQAFLPTLAVDGHGTVGILYDDFRKDRPGDRALTTDVWLSRSYDRGKSWHEVHAAGSFDMLRAPNSESSGVAGLFVGDYQGMAGLPRGFVAAFAQALPQALHGYSDVFFARWES